MAAASVASIMREQFAVSIPGRPSLSRRAHSTPHCLDRNDDTLNALAAPHELDSPPYALRHKAPR
jgi:hypothetical protein